MRIWELAPDPDPYLSVSPDDLRYFWTHFVGRRMADGWAIPPYSILGKSKKVADFTSWQIGSRTFLVTERAKAAIQRLCGDDVEFLPFDVIKRTALWAVNVLRTADLLDLPASEIGPGGYIIRAAFRHDLPTVLPPLFKVDEASSTYASASFGRMLAAERLTGVRLRDPAKSVIQQIRAGEQQNAFPGIRTPPGSQR